MFLRLSNLDLLYTQKRNTNMKKTPLILLASLLTFASADVSAGTEYVIEAPNGVGDVVALTNVLSQLNSLTAAQRAGMKIVLKPGLYDLRNTYMTADSHLNVAATASSCITGDGNGPEDTVLLGGGEAGGHRVMNLNAGGGVYSWMTISNLTVTGGYSKNGNGGGIAGSSTCIYRNLIVSNNYAKGSSGGGGGGCSYGRAYDCLFADNRTDELGGGLRLGAQCGQMGYPANVQGAWNCTFVRNVSTKRGGGLFLNSVCESCEFIENVAKYGGAISTDISSPGNYAATRTIRDCRFIGNDSNGYGQGAAVYADETYARPAISNCTFAANKRTGEGSQLVCCADLTDCVVTNNVLPGDLLYRCNLLRCYVARNDNAWKDSASSMDSAKSTDTNISVNCVFEANTNWYGFVSRYKRLVNCTYVDNFSRAGVNFGGIVRDVVAWNCLFSDNWIQNKKQDIRAKYNGTTYDSLPLTNCVFTASDVGADCAGMANCKLVSNVRFKPSADGGAYDIKTSSPAYDAGTFEAWMTPFFGTTDFVGRPRVFNDAIDVGALECQLKKPGMALLVR